MVLWYLQLVIAVQGKITANSLIISVVFTIRTTLNKKHLTLFRIK